MKKLVTAATAATVIAVLSAGGASAMDGCKVSVDKTGVILVDASGVSGVLKWGEEEGSESNAFYNIATCVADTKAKKCQIADPATLASKTPPAGCTLYLDDDGTACSAWIRGCTPGPREAGSGGGSTPAQLIDADDDVVGLVMDGFANGVVIDFSGTIINVALRPDLSNFSTYDSLLFASADCSGAAYLGSYDFVSPVVKKGSVYGNSVYYPTAPAANFNPGSRLNVPTTPVTNQAGCDAINTYNPTTYVSSPTPGCCEPYPYSIYAAPTATKDVSGFTRPFTLSLQ